MLKDFKEQQRELEKTIEFKKFHENNKTYYLAHGFAQLNKDFEPTKNWQIGYYSKEKDHLAIFDINNLQEPSFEEAFKDGGIIEELKIEDEQISLEEALDLAKKKLFDDYKGEIVNTVLVIVQAIEGEPTFNFTFVTQNFSMITIHVNARTKTITKEIKNSVLDLKKN